MDGLGATEHNRDLGFTMTTHSSLADVSMRAVTEYEPTEVTLTPKIQQQRYKIKFKLLSRVP